MKFINIPLRTKRYVARNCDKNIKDYLEKSATQILEITGMPGTGKSTLINELLYTQRSDLFKDYDFIGWINCGDDNITVEHIFSIAKALGFNESDKSKAFSYLVDHCKNNDRWLLIFNHADRSKHLEEFLNELKYSTINGQVVYTTTSTLEAKMQPQEVIKLEPFSLEETQNLVKKWLLAKDAESDLTKLYEISSGFPEAIIKLCEAYNHLLQYHNFNEFCRNFLLDDTIFFALKNSVQNALARLTEKAQHIATANRALHIIKQSVYLKSTDIPANLFTYDKNTDYPAINELANLNLFNFNRDKQVFNMPLILQVIMQRLYEKEKMALIKANNKILQSVFNCLSSNDSQINLETLVPYVEHVNYLLLELVSNLTLQEKQDLAKDPVIAENMFNLWASLARFYYRYHGQLKPALTSLMSGKTYLEELLTDKVIDYYRQVSKDFEKAQKQANSLKIDAEKQKLLLLYAEEFLHQIGTISSQLISREDKDKQIITNFKDAYHIQLNLKGSIISRAYILRNLTRALRKQSRISETNHYFAKLEQEAADKSINEVTRAELCIDKGIMLKEAEDLKPDVSTRDYKEALKHLREVEKYYQSHNQNGKRNYDLGILCIYLGDATVANGEVEKGIGYYYQLLNYLPSTADAKHAQAYFNLAWVLYDNHYYALAKIYIEKAMPLQVKVFGENHAYVRVTKAKQLELQEALIKAVESFGKTTTEPSLDLLANVNSNQELNKLEESFHQSLLQQVKQQLNISKESLLEADKVILYQIKQKDLLKELQKQREEIVKRNEVIVKEKNLNQLIQQLTTDKQNQWYEMFARKIEIKDRLKHFVDSFEEKLLNRVVKEIRKAIGKDISQSSAETAGGVIKGLAPLLPKIEASAKGVTATIDLPAVVQGVTEALVTRHVKKEKTGAVVIDETYKMEDLYKEVRTYVHEMAEYTARCYQPQIDKLDEKTWKDDVEILAKIGVKRVISYQKKGKVSLLKSAKELIMISLQKGEGDKSLSKEIPQTHTLFKKHWHVHGFFAQSGIQVYREDTNENKSNKQMQQYLPKTKEPQHEIYDFRYGSPVEVEIRHYQPVYNNKR